MKIKKQILNKTRNQLRRRCKNCTKRITLLIIRRGGNIFIKCPKCLVESKWELRNKKDICNVYR